MVLTTRVIAAGKGVVKSFERFAAFCLSPDASAISLDNGSQTRAD